MVGLFTAILDAVELIGSYVLFGFETGVNAVFAALGAAASAVLSVLPSMSDAPVLGSPSWLGWLNWFYPVGDLIAGLILAVTLWTAFLVIRWTLRLLRLV